MRYNPIGMLAVALKRRPDLTTTSADAVDPAMKQSTAISRATALRWTRLALRATIVGHL
jgi:hypothetical protein